VQLFYTFRLLPLSHLINCERYRSHHRLLRHFSLKADNFRSTHSSEAVHCAKCGGMIQSRDADAQLNDDEAYEYGDEIIPGGLTRSACAIRGERKEGKSDALGDVNNFKSRLINSINGSREKERGRVK
jgi:hypothetical protein